MVARLFELLSDTDFKVASQILGPDLREPDLTIAPDGEPYIYRWHVIPRNTVGANVYFHIQVQSDPERPLHDHPWDNTSFILAGGYIEMIQKDAPRKLGMGVTNCETRRKGDMISRKAEDAHRLILPDGCPYAMTLFSTGPVRRDWGFWIPNHRGVPKWVSHHECIVALPDGRSMFREPANVR